MHMPGAQRLSSTSTKQGLGETMASASQATAFLQEDDFLEQTDGVADLVPLRRAAQAQRPEQQLRAWVDYAGHLEARLDHVCAQLETARRQCSVQRILHRGHESGPARRASALDADDDHGLELLARLRAEQVMTVRLLNLLARHADLKTLADPRGEAAAVLEVRQRQQLRAQDLQASLAEHRALRQAQRDGRARAGEGCQATSLQLPAGFN
jgi:hypothetical protein